MNIFCVTSQFSAGCTFLEWSVHWLAGHRLYYNVNKNDWIELISNPLSKTSVINAHEHQKNHPSGLKRAQETIDKLCNLTRDYTYSLYPFRMRTDRCCQELGIDIWSLHQSDLLAKVMDHIGCDYNAIIAHCAQRKVPVAYVYFDQQSLTYTWNDRSLDNFITTTQSANHPDELVYEFDQVFCYENKKQWHSDADNSIWDTRERLALNIRPFHFFVSEVDDRSCHRIYCRDLWFDTKKTTIDFLMSLGLTLDPQRLAAWLPIAQVWQDIHRQNLWFPENLSNIVDAIVHGLDQPLPKLTLKQECIIQHCLIYQHDLNLKTWNLTKFPNNTLELHNLLEPNIHKIY